MLWRLCGKTRQENLKRIRSDRAARCITLPMNSDISPVIAAVIETLVEPYADFIARLHSEGRITAQEVEGVNTAVDQRKEGLAESVRDYLQGVDWNFG